MLQLFFSFYSLIMMTLFNRIKKLNITLRNFALASVFPLLLFLSMFFSKIKIETSILLLYCEFCILLLLLALQLFSKYTNFVFASLSILLIAILSIYPNLTKATYFYYAIIILGILFLLLSYFKWNLKLYILQLFLLSIIGKYFLVINSPQLLTNDLYLYTLLIYFFPFYEIYKTWNDYELKQSQTYKKLDDEFEDELRKEIKIRTLNIEKHNMVLRETNKLDKMTDAYNKNALVSIIDDLTKDKRKTEFSVLMFDIDKFKIVNDTYGHIIGDQCIKFLAKTATQTIRSHDFLGRFGGDEFMIVLPQLGLNDAFLVAERFKNQIENLSNPKFTISIGISTFPNDGTNSESLIHFADEGLYLSKSSGRNMISHKKI